jgi:hypothetical protein
MARTMASLSSFVPAPTCEPAPAGPHCFGGGALTDVRRPCPGFLLRELLGSAAVPSLPMTFAAMPWIADHEFPHSPESGLDVLRAVLELCALAEFMNDEAGGDATVRRDLGETPGLVDGIGKPFLDGSREPVLLAPPSLASVP